MPTQPKRELRSIFVPKQAEPLRRLPGRRHERVPRPLRMGEGSGSSAAVVGNSALFRSGHVLLPRRLYDSKLVSTPYLLLPPAVPR